MSFLTFLIGLAIGGALGMFVTCLAVASGGEDDE